MDALRRTFEQFLDLYRSMSPSQRGTLVVVPLMIVGAFGVLMLGGDSSSYTPVSWGKVFSPQEMNEAEQTLREAGLTDIRRENGQLLVPQSEAERYNAALLEKGGLPTDWASEWEKKFEGSAGIFTSRKQLETMKEIALAKELGRVIRALPHIEEASVVWASSNDRPRWPDRNRKVKATVYVRPRSNHEISRPLAQSLRTAVANSVPDLVSPTDVVVFDLANERTFSGDQEGSPLNNKVVERIQRFEQNYRDKIQTALSYIPEAIVSVNVDLENLRSSVEREQSVDPENTVALAQSEETRNETIQKEPVSTEPGAAPNVAREIRQNSGTQSSESTTEESSRALSAASFRVMQKEYIAAMPEAVQVSVQIPEDYYRQIALKQGLTTGETEEEQQQFQQVVDQIRTEVEADVREQVSQNIPADSPDSAVSVGSYEPIERDVPDLSPSVAGSVSSMLAQWGSVIGLGLFALWALWMLHRSMAKSPAAEQTLPPSTPSLWTEEDDDDEEDDEQEQQQPEPEVTRRDQLQSVVRDNPEVAASVIAKWLQPSNQSGDRSNQ